MYLVMRSIVVLALLVQLLEVGFLGSLRGRVYSLLFTAADSLLRDEPFQDEFASGYQQAAIAVWNISDQRSFRYEIGHALEVFETFLGGCRLPYPERTAIFEPLDDVGEF